MRDQKKTKIKEENLKMYFLPRSCQRKFEFILCLHPSGKRSLVSLSERLKKVEHECKQKEEERVNLELELTEVKESLKKALSGGVTLGLTIEPKPSSSGLQVRTCSSLESSCFFYSG